MAIIQKSDAISTVNSSSLSFELIQSIDEKYVAFINSTQNFPGFTAFHPNYSCKDFKNKIVFCAGFPLLSHELAHFIEIDDQRFNKPDFGLGGPKEFRAIKTSKAYIAATLREERVCGIQTFLSGKKPTKEDSKIHKNSFWESMYKPLNDKPYSLEELKAVCLKEYFQAYESCSADKIRDVFNHRINCLYKDIDQANKVKLAA